MRSEPCKIGRHLPGAATADRCRLPSGPCEDSATPDSTQDLTVQREVLAALVVSAKRTRSPESRTRRSTWSCLDLSGPLLRPSVSEPIGRMWCIVRKVLERSCWEREA